MITIILSEATHINDNIAVEHTLTHGTLKKVSPTAARITFDERLQNHARHCSYRQIHPPLKNVIYTLGVKSISEI